MNAGHSGHILLKSNLKKLIGIWATALWIWAIAATPASAQSAPANWLETRIAIEELAAAEDYVAALALGDRLLRLAATEFEENSSRLAESHLLLARVHLANGDFQAAEEQTLAAIDVFEASAGRLSPELIEPFLALGDAYSEAEDYTAAISAWGEARTIGRRNYGLLNEGQLPIIDRMTDAAEKLNDIASAKGFQQDALVLVERVHGPDSLEAMEARFKYAAWLREHDFLAEELRLYFEIQRTIQDHFDNDPVLITRVMRERAMSFRHTNNGDPLGLNGLRDALDLLEEMEEPPPLLLAGLLVDIGDWYVEFSRTTGDEYLRAWELLGEVENGAELRQAWFVDLNEIELRPLSRRDLSSNPEDPAGFVIISFVVDTSGNTRSVEITDSHPAGLKDASAISSFADAKFRPRIIDGELVPAPRIYRLDFRYQPQDD